MTFTTRRTFIKSAACITGGFIIQNSAFGKEGKELSLLERMLPAPLKGGFAMDDYWVWDSSVVKGEDGLFHMFASRWSKEFDFGNWVTNSQIVRAV